MPVLQTKKVTYIFEVVSSSRPLKATLVWMDPPNSVSANKQLLHDLDLTVKRVRG